VRVDSGASQSFAIAADTGYDIADVLVDGKSVGAAPSYEFAKVDASHTIAASFSVMTFSITATAGAGGTITPSGDVRVDSGASQSFAIAADTGYDIADVLVDGKSVGAAPSYEFAKVDASHTIAASFSVVTFSITATAGEGGTITPSGDVEVDSGADIEFVITPTTGHRIKDVLVDTVSIGAVSSHQFTDVTAAHAITAFFALVADQGHHVAYGSVFTVQASDLGKTSFEKPPKVMSSGGGKAKNLNFQKGAASVNCAWTGKDKPNTYALLVDGVLLTEEFVVENPAAFPVSLSADSGVAGDMIVVTGKYFGSKCPKVTMEFIDAKGKAKKANCKVSKPYAYADANGKPGKSVMEVRTGESALSFTVPKGITGATPATLKLNCNGNMIQEPFNATK